MEVTIKLTVDDVNAILQVLGEMPTKTGMWPLAVSIKEQAEAQIPKLPEENSSKM